MLKKMALALTLAAAAVAATAAVALPRDMTIIEYYSDATHQEPVGIWVENCSGRRASEGVVTAYTETYRHRCYNGIDYDLPNWVWDRWPGIG